jgi:hypothetical protein
LPPIAVIAPEILALLSGQPQQQRGVHLVEVLLDAEQHAHVEVLGGDQLGLAGEHDADRPGPCRGQRDRRGVGVEAELRGQLEHPPAGLLADAGPAVQGV